MANEKAVVVVNVLVTGGCGYVGAVLVPWLLVDGHYVTVLDTMWFGDGHLPDNGHLTVVRGDVRDDEAMKAACDGKDAVIWLASLSNNDMCTLWPSVAQSVNCDAFAIGLEIARNAGVKRLIYASSVAVYGNADIDVAETHQPKPRTLYGDGKLYCESLALAPQEMSVCVTRSASVCGASPRQRFDITANKMVHDAMRFRSIIVNGGSQKRCHIHIQDLARAYLTLLNVSRERVAGQAFNFVAENSTVLETAKTVADVTGAKVMTSYATDDRSYTVDGTKAREVLGFVPKKTVRDAALDLKVRFDSDALGITNQYRDSLTDKRFMNMADELV